ncbi:MAG: hypothetical protein WCO19_02120 [Candidatus Saccharibacteria bacterium]
MPEFKATRGTFLFFPEHAVTEHAGHEYLAIQSGQQGRVLVLAEELARDNERAAVDLGPIITKNMIGMIALFDGIDGVFRPDFSGQ